MKNNLKNVKLIGLLSLLLMTLAGCGKNELSALRPAGEVAKDQFNLMMLAVGIMVFVIIVVVVIFILAVFKFRRGKVGEDFVPKDVHGNHKLEVIWTTIPIILLIILAIPTVMLTFKLADTKAMDKIDANGKNKEMIVNVTANLYWWEFEYPNQGIVTSQELVVPTDTKVYFRLHSADVKHSFWIPAVGGKMDTNVENINKFYLVFDGKKAQDAKNMFYGKCAELCGPSHALMDFKVKTMDKDQFKTWVSDMKAIKKPLATTDAKEGEKVFKQSCQGCHAVTPTGKGAKGPNLTTFGDRNRVAGVMEYNEENLKKWIKDPESVKPGNKMTGAYKVSDSEIDALAKYLMERKVEK
ncbi:cytochrome c oxidase subunit II [Macrococcoides canis]|uniref:cytochrome c oxidase subunit II n=1 Tax=Macrococcoides canis TaxID=1855823 RepID=UPI00207D165C|nr:cytochrome c oxidase subunit II [Macrococcus canis]MCO4096464.1 cytochrome c oxidase subunit II [Macrococcus canis]UTH10091.1 cytochrome c oxidase subunit II [Macrococcus canis]